MEIIKPVIFVDDKIEANEDLNSIFVLPQKLKFTADCIKSTMLEGIKESKIDPNFYENWSKRFIMGQQHSSDIVIETYITRNIMELVRINILSFIELNFEQYIKNKMVLFNYSHHLANFEQNLSSIVTACGQRCRNIVDQYSLTYPEKKNLIYISLEQISDIIISHLTNTYDAILYDKIMYMFKLEDIYDIYKDMYDEVYHEDAENFTFESMYVFFSTILRELMEGEVIDVRNAMTMVMQNAATMILNSVYGNQIANLDYSYLDFQEDNEPVEYDLDDSFPDEYDDEIGYIKGNEEKEDKDE